MATRIMLVDDDKNLTESLQTMLKSRGYRSVEAADCDHALPLFSRERFDLILVDSTLPDNSGFRGDELLKEKVGEGTAIVISSPNALKTLAMKPPLWASFSRNVTSMIRLSSIKQLTESHEYFQPPPRHIAATSQSRAREGFDAVGAASQEIVQA